MSKLIPYKTSTYLFSGIRLKEVNSYYIQRGLEESQIKKTDIDMSVVA